jgi:DNA processing protein
MSKFVSYCVDASSAVYPGKLRMLKDPPKSIYVKGDLDGGLLSRGIVGIVGSRKIFQYSREILRHIFREVLPINVATVSGFMFGVDTEAHKLSLENFIPTIAVLPCGIDAIHPVSNYALYDKIPGSGGLIISEYPGFSAPKKWTFVNRNRIIAALSDILIVVQAGEKSGSLITANYANKLGKPVLAVTAGYFHRGFEGNLQLLSTYAKALVSDNQINQLLGYAPGKLIKDTSNKSSLLHDEKVVYDHLCEQPASPDILAVRLKLPVKSVSMLLTNLQIKGVAFETDGVYHAR